MRVTKARLIEQAEQAMGRGASVSVRETPIGWVAEARTHGGHVAFRATGVTRASVYEQLLTMLVAP
jgi:hypothetical protein